MLKINNYLFVRYLAGMLLFINTNTLHAQSDETTPNDKYVNVDLFRANLNISIPLYTFKTKYLSCPISLDYSAPDLSKDKKVIYNEDTEVYDTTYSEKRYYGGTTGLGWNLNAGGCITRKIRGIPDESQADPVTHLGIGNFSNRLTKFDPNTNQEYDPEEDEFSYSFCGHTGMFIFYRGDWKVFSDDDFLIISRIIEPRTIGLSTTNFLSGFTIGTPDGMTYTFGGKNATSTSCYSGEAFTPAMAWYLTCIESPEGERINLTYDFNTANNSLNNIYYPQTQICNVHQETRSINENMVNTSTGTTIKEELGNPMYIDIQFPSVEQVLNQSVGALVSQIRLKRISSESNQFSVDFNYVATTEPFTLNGFYRNPMKLDNMVVGYGDDSKSFKKFSFSYADQTSETLKLTSLQETALSGNTTIGTLPPFGFSYAGKADETAPETITQLSYPTGGYTTFEYDYQPSGIGQRIKKQTTHGVQSDKELTTLYNFLAPQKTNETTRGSISIDKDGNLLEGYRADVGLRKGLIYGDGYQYVLTKTGCGLYSDNLLNSTVQDYVTGYSSAWVIQSANNAANANEVMGYKHYNFLNYIETKHDDIYATTYENANDVGKITAYEEYNAQQELIKKIAYEYNQVDKTEELYRYSLHTFDYYSSGVTNFSNNKHTYCLSYGYGTNYYKLKLAKKTETDVYNRPIETKYTYDINKNFLRDISVSSWDLDLNSIKNNLSDGKESLTTHTTSYRYLSDFDDQVGGDGWSDIANGYQLHRVQNMPIETVYKKDGKVIGAELVNITNYTIPSQGYNYTPLANSFNRPTSIYTLDITQPISNYSPASADWTSKDSRMKSRMTFGYDVFGNLSWQSDASGNTVRYIDYSTERSSPLIIQKGLAACPTAISDLSNDPENIMKKRAAMPTVQITSYTYDPIFGITSVTTPNGLSKYYEYDCFGRLLSVKDTNHNLLKTYEYTNAQ